MDEAFNDVAMVSCALVLMAMLQMPFGPMAALTGRSPGQQKWGERIFMNMTEQAPLFLTSLWAFALVVSPERAASLGMIYLGLRALYAPIWLFAGGESGAPFPAILVSTFPQYGINVYFALAVVLKVAFSMDITSFFMGSDKIGVIAVSFAFFVYAAGVIPKVHIALTCFFDKPAEDKKD
uniref:Uncharacterized protein n=1 Tax=Attheya septentrionalis TaxID=420275 RepID=A0A7S2U6Y9_9STRA|mmetsp:Transcript_10991/g.20088  ORF Transcript_10991/g.20088 Transcript_10991/m.20088 type:complete len:180 (+) Transcript_10991:40-579(+)